MSATSTPTPWYAQYNGYYWDITTAPEQYSPFLASVFSPENVRDGQANAEHIVRCVNAHDALVDTLERILRCDEDCQQAYLAAGALSKLKEVTP